MNKPVMPITNAYYFGEANISPQLILIFIGGFEALATCRTSLFYGSMQRELCV